MTKEELASLEARAKEIRAKTIDAIGFLGVGHIGGALSIVELLAVLYYRHLKHDPSNPAWEGRDRLVLSKGHAGPALYATLALRGFFPAEWLHTLNKGGTNLPSHCDRNKTPGIDMTTGSLGQGLSAACGLALANRLDGRDSFTFAVIGDGESNEGQNWEAALFAAQQRLGRLVAFTDYNKMQIDGKTDEILGLGALEEKWAAFGWETARVDGHDMAAIDAAVEAAKARAAAAAAAGTGGKPTMIVLDTVKGKGAKFCEGSVGSHNMAFDYETAKKAIAELG
ncbi:MAG: transketolase [Spirochaetaceae bacterium]|nr:transketolase [Spirochaetaceae bacterium]